MGYAIQSVKLANPTGEFLSGLGTVVRQSWAALAASADTGVLAATTQPASGTTVVTTGITNPAVPRAVRIKGNQATCTGNVVVVGTDYFGAAQTDTIAASGTSAVQGVKVFRKITSITIPTRGAVGDTISLGPGTAIGLSRVPSDNGACVISAAADQVREGTLPTINKTNATCVFNTAPNGAIGFVLYFLHEDLQHT